MPMHPDAGQNTKKRSRGEKLHSVWERAEKGGRRKTKDEKRERRKGRREITKRVRQGGTVTEI